jgi:hypothetical protein
MATAIKDLTRLGTDVRQIARLLQKKAPPGHKLAYINEEEAALLKSRGGSGRITESGIPSYEEEPTGFGETPAPSAPITSGGESTGFGETPVSAATGGGGFSAPSAPESAPIDIGFGPGSFAPTPAPTQISPSLAAGGGLSSDQAKALYGDQGYGATTTPAQEAGVTVPKQDQTQPSKGLSEETKYRLGIGGLEAVLGASQARAAASQGQAAKTALMQQAAPYQQQGQALLASAQRGELTPANQQILQAAQAQAAQNVATRGGVGAMQAQNQINALAQQLLTNQLNLGLQLQSVGDKIAQGAIQAGVQADQYVNQLTNNYAMNIARTLLPGTAPTTTTPTPAGGNV